MTYLELLIEILYIIWTVCSLTVILAKPKDIFKENIYGEDLTPLTNIWILFTIIGVGAFLIMFAGSTKVFWEE